MVWLKIREHDIFVQAEDTTAKVVVWLKIREHDITAEAEHLEELVVVWLKIREHDIPLTPCWRSILLWFD